ncbi:MAG TPA: hypothetical protein VHS27_04580 [Gaiellales bacterium]|nr:hypothetical protein [Gaiellales bacterium]
MRLSHAGRGEDRTDAGEQLAIGEQLGDSSRATRLFTRRGVNNDRDMTAVLYLGGGACLIAFVVALAIATTGQRYGAVLLLGLVLGAAWFAFVLVTAGTDPNRPDCSDCEYLWGRWWWPPLVIAVLGLNLAGWLVGATGGWLARRGRRPA